MSNNTGSSIRSSDWAARWATVFVVSAGLAACSLAGPPPTEYVLGSPTAATTTTKSQTGLPVVQVLPVQLPDYLDTTDLLVRSGSQIIPSPTGRWGERLSVGVTRDLVASIAARLPYLTVTASPPIDRPARQVLVDIVSYEATGDRRVILLARWTITDGTRQIVMDAQQVSIAVPVASSDDAVVVAAMSDALADGAAQIAAAIERNSPIRGDRNGRTDSGGTAERSRPASRSRMRPIWVRWGSVVVKNRRGALSFAGPKASRGGA